MSTQSKQINELATALAKAQGAMENASMNRINPHFRSRYADLASMLDAIRAPLSSNGLAITQLIELRNGAMVLRTLLMHAGSGQWLASEYPLPIGKPQEMGSAQTYARRYSLAAIVCNSSEEDDDANAAQAIKQNGKGADTGELLSGEQLEKLQTMLDEAGLKEERFCTRFKIGGLSDLPSAKLSNAIEAINNYAAQKAKTAAEAKKEQAQ